MSPQPTLSRRHAVGSASARGLLFTVLGEFVLPAGGIAWTSALIDVLGRLGVEEKAARQALMRTSGAGWLAAERLGRRTRWQLTASAERLLTDGTERIYGFTGSRADWDRRWLVVLARAPESERPTRHMLRTRLRWAGFGNPAPGVWIGPHVERAGEVAAVLEDAGTPDAQVFIAEHRTGELAALVGQAWDLDAVAGEYRAFLTAFSGTRPDDPLASTVELVHSWRRFPWIDPELPDELLPRNWDGRAAAALFAQRHHEWSPAARRSWAALNELAA